MKGVDPLTRLSPLLITELNSGRFLGIVWSSEGRVSLLLKLLVSVDVDTQLCGVYCLPRSSLYWSSAICLAFWQFCWLTLLATPLHSFFSLRDSIAVKPFLNSNTVSAWVSLLMTSLILSSSQREIFAFLRKGGGSFFCELGCSESWSCWDSSDAETFSVYETRFESASFVSNPSTEFEMRPGQSRKTTFLRCFLVTRYLWPFRFKYR